MPRGTVSTFYKRKVIKMIFFQPLKESCLSPQWLCVWSGAWCSGPVEWGEKPLCLLTLRSVEWCSKPQSCPW